MSKTNGGNNASITELKKDALLPGDIIATRNHTVGSKGIRFLTGGQASHAILYTGGIKGIHYAVDANTKKGVTRDRLDQKITPASYAVVFRPFEATTEQRDKACEWALRQAQRSKPYDHKSAVGVGKPTKYTGVGRLIIAADNLEAWLSPEGEDASFMCSELVFRAYEIAGAPLVDKPAHNLSPASLFKTERLACLGRLI